MAWSGNGELGRRGGVDALGSQPIDIIVGAAVIRSLALKFRRGV